MSAVRVTLLAAGLLAVLAPAAPAAVYDVWSCRGPDGEPVSAEAWAPNGTVATPGARVDTCATGGALHAQLTAAPADRAAGAATGFRLALPADVEPVEWQLWMAARVSTPPWTGGQYQAGLSRRDEAVGNGVGVGCGTFALTCTYGDLDTPLAAANQVSGTWSPWTALSLGAFCFSDSPCSPGAAPVPAEARIFRSRVRVEDGVAPAVGALGGSVVAAGAVSGTRSVRAQVTDAGGGVLRTELLVDGAVHTVQEGIGRCSTPFTAPIPCPAAERAAFDLDTTTLADGPHTLRIRAFDAALNSAESTPLAVVVDNRPPARPPAAPPVVVPAPPVPPAPPAAIAPAESPAGLRVELPRRQQRPGSAPVRGVVRGSDGGPRAGVAIRFERRPLGGDREAWRPLGTASTGADGRFRLPSIRESGEVRAVVVGGATTASVRFVRALRTTVRRSASRLRNGQRFTLHGTVDGDGDAWTGRDALVQSRVSGRWRTVDSVRVARGGRLTWRYRFTSTRRPARYRFRFVLPAVKGLPWAATRTSTVTVLVRPR